jgi:membrane protein
MDEPTHRRTRTGRLLAKQLLGFLLRALRGFFNNGGVELAGAVAYNGLLSVVPLFLLTTAIFTRFVDRERFLQVVAREIHQLLPSVQAQPVNAAILALLEVQFSGGLVGLITLIFFSTLAFRTLQHALDVIFIHRRETHDPRPLWVSILISLGYVTALGLVSLLQTLALVSLDKFPWLADKVPRSAGVLGLLGMALVLASIYVVMPLGKGSSRAALIGGSVAALMWQGLQRVLVWYFANISAVSLIYGSLAGIIVVLFSFELAAAIVLLAAQVIAEIEKSWRAGLHWYEAPPATNTTRPPRPASAQRP